jgi:hypothetical protein
VDLKKINLFSGVAFAAISLVASFALSVNRAVAETLTPAPTPNEQIKQSRRQLLEVFVDPAPNTKNDLHLNRYTTNNQLFQVNGAILPNTPPPEAAITLKDGSIPYVIIYDGFFSPKPLDLQNNQEDITNTHIYQVSNLAGTALPTASVDSNSVSPLKLIKFIEDIKKSDGMHPVAVNMSFGYDSLDFAKVCDLLGVGECVLPLNQGNKASLLKATRNADPKTIQQALTKLTDAEISGFFTYIKPVPKDRPAQENAILGYIANYKEQAELFDYLNTHNILSVAAGGNPRPEMKGSVNSPELERFNQYAGTNPERNTFDIISMLAQHAIAETVGGKIQLNIPNNTAALPQVTFQRDNNDGGHFLGDAEKGSAIRRAVKHSNDRLTIFITRDAKPLIMAMTPLEQARLAEIPKATPAQIQEILQLHIDAQKPTLAESLKTPFDRAKIKQAQESLRKMPTLKIDAMDLEKALPKEYWGFFLSKTIPAINPEYINGQSALDLGYWIVENGVSDGLLYNTTYNITLDLKLALSEFKRQQVLSGSSFTAPTFVQHAVDGALEELKKNPDSMNLEQFKRSIHQQANKLQLLCPAKEDALCSAAALSKFLNQGR